MQISNLVLLSAAVLLMGAPAFAADSEKQAKARDALRQKMDEMDHRAPVKESPAITKAREATRQKLQELQNSPAELSTPAVVATPGKKGVQYAPIEPPPSTLVGDKQEKLAELLRLYQADRMTSEDYHRERQKILAQP